MRTIVGVKPDRVINLACGFGAGEGNPHQVARAKPVAAGVEKGG
jgi:hypothetical protein